MICSKCYIDCVMQGGAWILILMHQILRVLYLIGKNGDIRKVYKIKKSRASKYIYVHWFNVYLKWTCNGELLGFANADKCWMPFITRNEYLCKEMKMAR